MARPMNDARREAKLAGLTFYHSRTACPQGHMGERYTSTNACRQCVRSQVRPDRPARRPRKPKAADDFEQLLTQGN